MFRTLASAVVTAIAAIAGSCEPAPAPPPSPAAAFEDGFDRADGLVTNEYATWNPSSPSAVRSDTWTVSSGSLSALGGTGWTGVPDGESPDALSMLRTGSAVFRVTSRDTSFGSVAVDLDLRVNAQVATSRTPAVAWDGVHVFLRYQSEDQLYYASVSRRDGSLAIKKKCPGGTTNGGTYYTLASTPTGSHPIATSWRHVTATIDDRADGGVTIGIRLDGASTPALTAVDHGTGCAALRGTGAVGLRGDNTDFQFDEVIVTSR